MTYLTILMMLSNDSFPPLMRRDNTHKKSRKSNWNSVRPQSQLRPQFQSQPQHQFQSQPQSKPRQIWSRPQSKFDSESEYESQKMSKLDDSFPSLMSRKQTRMQRRSHNEEQKSNVQLQQLQQSNQVKILSERECQRIEERIGSINNQPTLQILRKQPHYDQQHLQTPLDEDEEPYLEMNLGGITSQVKEYWETAKICNMPFLRFTLLNEIDKLIDTIDHIKGQMARQTN